MFGYTPPSLKFATGGSIDRTGCAAKRLLRDLKEVQATPLGTICAQPLESNILEWHANLIGPPGTLYEGCCLHLVITFGDDYPLRPPKVSLKTSIPRSAVFGDFLCLDMLEAHYFTPEKYHGWSSGYSVLAILIQLQAFLFEDVGESTYSAPNAEYVLAAMQNAAEYKCTKCTHAPGAPWPYHKAWAMPMKPEQVVTKRLSVRKAVEDIKQSLEQRRNQRYGYGYGYERREKKPAEPSGLPQGWDTRLDIRQTPSLVVPTTPLPAVKAQPSEPKVSTPVPNAWAKPLTLTRAPAPEKPVATARQPTTPPSSARAAVPARPRAQPSAETIRIGQLMKEIPQETVLHIFSYMAAPDLVRSGQVCKSWSEISQDVYLWERKETICFHSKVSCNEDVLGVGISLVIHPKTGKLDYVTTPLDLVSHSAFTKEGVRCGVWREPFTHWMPLYINGKHGEKAAPLMELALTQVFGMEPHEFQPDMALNLLSKLMNTMVVDVMNGEVHASIKALQGYCACHRWLIYFVETYPELKRQVETTISNFLASSRNRHKHSCPSIGNFLPLLSVSSRYKWSDVCRAVIQETLDRNALWILKKYPALEDRENVEVTERIQKSFEATQVSLRLQMFQVYFLEMVQSSGSSLSEIARNYDMRYGRPTLQMQEKMQRAIFQIQRVQNYQEFFRRVKHPLPVNAQAMSRVLVECMDRSAGKRYHTPGSFKRAEGQR